MCYPRAGVLNPGPKSVQNGPQMAPKCPRGPFRARQGPFGSHFGSVFGTQVPTTLINVYYNVQIEAFVATFLCYIACKAVIGMLGLLGTSGALLGGLLVASEPLFGLLEPILGLSW